MTIHITITPTKTTAKGQWYEARHGNEVVAISRTPFHSAARALSDQGHSPDTVLTMSHAGSDTVSLRSTLRAAARLMVVENGREAPRFARYRPHPEETARAAVSNRPRTAETNVPGRVAQADTGAAL